MPGPIHRFGPFTFDSGQKLLFRDGEPVPLMPKTADLLHALLERRGEVVSKAELMKLVWPDAQVEETGLARNVSLLRKALGDEGAESRFIETVPKRGYRFLAEESPAAGSARFCSSCSRQACLCTGSFTARPVLWPRLRARRGWR